MRSSTLSNTKKKYSKSLYEANPNTCMLCGSPLPWDKRNNKFCNGTCFARYNNRNRVPCVGTCSKCGNEFESTSGNRRLCDRCSNKVQHNVVCTYCGKVEVKSYSSKFCSIKCQQDFAWQQRKKEIEKSGSFSERRCASANGETNLREARRYLIEKFGHKCSICGLSEWMGQPIPLVVDHIDGNPTNHKVCNFRLVCGNCDMQLPTYKAKNKGNGRKYRRQSQTQT